MKDVNLEILTPTTWKDFMMFYNETYEGMHYMKNIEFLKLPFELQLGVYLRYFNENGLDWDIQNVDSSQWPSVLLDVFKAQEKIIGHFS